MNGSEWYPFYDRFFAVPELIAEELVNISEAIPDVTPTVWQKVCAWIPTVSRRACVAGGVSVGIVLFSRTYVARRVAKGVTSWLVAKFCRRFNSTVRSDFNSGFVFTRGTVYTDTHSHPLAAAIRTGADTSIDAWAKTVGFNVISISRSNRDRRGQRFMYSDRDLKQDFANANIDKNSLLKFTDVIDHCSREDLEHWISYRRPICAFVFTPTEAAGSAADSRYWFEDNKVVYVVNGGATYRHELWDLNVDFLRVDYWWGRILCEVTAVRIPGEPTRRIVLIVPVISSYKPWSWLWPGDAQTLRRLEPLHGHVNVVRSVHDSKEYLSLADEGTQNAVKVTAAMYDSIKIRLRESKKPGISDVERYLYKDDADTAALRAPLLFKLIVHGMKLPRGTVGTTVGEARIKHWQNFGPIVSEEVTCYARAFAEPIMEPAFFPAITFNNSVASIADRVEFIRNNVDPPQRYHKWAQDFVEGLCPPASVVPLSHEEVYSRLETAIQRGRADREWAWLYQHSDLTIVKAFIKREAYNNVTKGPRNISTLPTDHLLRASAYTLPFKEQVLKRIPWYTPGCNPPEIAERVVGMASQFDRLMEADYSSMDGSESPFTRKLVEMVYAHAFGHDPELIALMGAESKRRGFTREGHAYETGTSMLSGSPWTTDGNTIINAFVTYCGYRELQVLIDPILMPSMKYGDDSLDPADIAAGMQLATKNLGYTIKITLRNRGEPVLFLGRLFVCPWATLTSVQDPMRTLPKLHLTTVPQAMCDLRTAAAHKICGYLAIDRHTPLISNYCHMVARHYGIRPDAFIPRSDLIRDLPWHYDSENPWPQLEHDLVIMEDAVSRHLGITVGRLRELCDQLDDQQTAYPEVESRPWIERPVEVQPGVHIVATRSSRVDKMSQTSTPKTPSPLPPPPAAVPGPSKPDTTPSPPRKKVHRR